MSLEESWKGRFLSVASLFQSVEWTKGAQDIYQQVANELIRIVGCDSASIRLLAPGGDEMVGYVYAGNAKVLARRQYPTLPLGVGRMSVVFEKLEPLVYDFNAPDEADVTSDEGIALGYSHAVVVPLVADNAPVGAIDFLFKEGQFDSSPDLLIFLSELCKMLGTVAVTIGASNEVVGLKVSEEVRRIGSELHDNFAQPLSVIALEADKAIIAREVKDDGQIDESLRKISDLSRQSFSMMADEVALLHSAPSMSTDLVASVRKYVEGFQHQWGIAAEMVFSDEKLPVPNTVGNQAMQILHGALSNVLRHSRARHVIVTLSRGRGALELNIEDDGCGFDMRDKSAPRFGLKTMEERAKSVGGRLTVASVPGEGTSVFADIPLVDRMWKTTND